MLTDRYDDIHSIRGAVIDIPKFVANNPFRFDLGRSTQYYWTTNVALDAADFSNQLSNNLSETKGLKVFKNSLATKFTDDTFDKKYVYGSYSLIFQLMRLKINYKYDGSNYFTSAFDQDSKALSAAELVKKYGTHVLQDIKLGAKLNVLYQATTILPDRKKVSSTGLRYAMRKVFGLSTGELDPLDLYALNANSAVKIYYEAIGGDVSKLEKAMVNGNPFINTTNWSRTITPESAKFINISENGLIPLYDLINDAQKKAMVKAYIIKYMAENMVVAK